MNGKILAVIVAGVFLLAEGQAQNNPPSTNAAVTPTNSTASASLRPGVLQLFDGSLLHGDLLVMSPTNGVSWNFPAAAKALRFGPTNIASVRFDKTSGAVGSARPGSRFRFKNGDDIYGDLSQVTASDVALETWFGNDLKSAREAIHSIIFSRKGFATLYEGPTSADGWKMGNGPKPWIYKDG